MWWRMLLCKTRTHRRREDAEKFVYQEKRGWKRRYVNVRAPTHRDARKERGVGVETSSGVEMLKSS